MKYGFYLGPSGSGKSTKLINDIIFWSEEEPDKSFYIIVPDQYTMSVQKQVVEMHPRKGILNIDVLSFGRLYHTMVAELGNREGILLDDTGKNLLIRRVAQGLEGELKSVGSSINKTGYIHEIKSAISEFMQYGYAPDDIDKLIACAQKKNALKGKLEDLQRLYRAFNEYRVGKFTTTEERNTILAQGLLEAEFIKDSVVVFDGFTGFTPVQVEVIRSLFSRCEKVMFSLTIDQESMGEDYEGELFALSKKTISQVDRIGKEMGAERLPYIWSELVRKDDSELFHLERNIFRKKNNVFNGSVNAICLDAVDNPREELTLACSKIKQLVTGGEYFYKDIAIVTGDLMSYSLYAGECFGAFDIPYFVDNAHSLEINPFTDFLKNGIKVILNNFSYDSVMQLLRSGFTDIDSDMADMIDNYLYATGIRGYSRYENEFRRFPAFVKKVNKDTGKKEVSDEGLLFMKHVNQTREDILTLMGPLLELRNGKHKASYITSQLYEFIIQNKSAEKIRGFSEYFESINDFDKKKEYDQLYKKILGLLEQIHELLSDDELSLEEYFEIFEAGISELRISTIPVTRDYVLMGDIERSRLNGIKILFFLGINDGIIPAKVNKGGLISDIDREFLSENEDITLAPSPRQKMYTQRLYLYLNMTKPTEKLYLSYSLAGKDGKSKRPSYLVEQIKKLFPEITEEAKRQSAFPENERALWMNLADKMRGYAYGLCDKEALLNIYSFCLRKDEKRTSQTVADAFAQYEGEGLTRDEVYSLYGKELVNSVSRLEMFAKCACSHFLKYGMRISERETTKLEAFDNGIFMHNVIKQFSDSLEKSGKDWTSITVEEQEQLIADIFAKEAESYEDGKYHLTNVNRFELGKVERILKRTVNVIKAQLEKAEFEPLYTEKDFEQVISGEGAGLKHGESMKVVGRIDRIDICDKLPGDDIYTRVIDYKSSKTKEIEPAKLYYGLSLQLMLYMNQTLDILQKGYGLDEGESKVRILPAGMYYYHLNDPYILADYGDDEYAIQQAINKELRMEGITLKDNNTLALSGADKSDDGKSKVLKHVEMKAGEVKDEDRVIDLDAMNKILEFADKKMVELTNGIFDGKLGTEPVGDNACDYCEYSDVCGFDKKMPGCRKKTVPKMKVSELLSLIDDKKLEGMEGEEADG